MWFKLQVFQSTVCGSMVLKYECAAAPPWVSLTSCGVVLRNAAELCRTLDEWN